MSPTENRYKTKQKIRTIPAFQKCRLLKKKKEFYSLCTRLVNKRFDLNKNNKWRARKISKISACQLKNTKPFNTTYQGPPAPHFSSKRCQMTFNLGVFVRLLWMKNTRRLILTSPLRIPALLPRYNKSMHLKLSEFSALIRKSTVKEQGHVSLKQYFVGK